MSATQVKLRLDRARNTPLHVRWEIYRNAPTDVPGDSREKLHAIAERADTPSIIAALKHAILRF
jgi:hypothetical protein